MQNYKIAKWLKYLFFEIISEKQKVVKLKNTIFAA